jgi:hypothetical protein
MIASIMLLRRGARTEVMEINRVLAGQSPVATSSAIDVPGDKDLR